MFSSVKNNTCFLYASITVVVSCREVNHTGYMRCSNMKQCIVLQTLVIHRNASLWMTTSVQWQWPKHGGGILCVVGYCAHSVC
jgi:hypothetical protein